MGSLVIAAAANNYIERTASLPALTGLSMSGWVKLLTSTAGTRRDVCGVGYSGNAGGLVQWTDNNYAPIGNTLGNQITPAPANDVWVYIAFTHNAANGPRAHWWNAAGTYQVEGSGADPIPAGSLASMVVGARGFYQNDSRPGRYAYWKTWDRVLTQANFEAEMFSPTVVDTTNFNSGFADSATDIGPNSRNWTLGAGVGTDSDTPPVTSGPTYMLLSRTYP